MFARKGGERGEGERNDDAGKLRYPENFLIAIFLATAKGKKKKTKVTRRERGSSRDARIDRYRRMKDPTRNWTIKSRRGGRGEGEGEVAGNIFQFSLRRGGRGERREG